MSNKLKVKIAIDIVMTILMIALMAYSLTGQMLHEILGVIVFILFLIHNILNIGYYKNIFKGKYKIARTIRLIINILLIIYIICLMVSGIVMSGYVFKFLNFENGMAFARAVHLAASYWVYVLISLHLGTHWSMVTLRLNNITNSSKKVHLLLRLIAIALVLYGLYVFIKYRIFDYMILNTMFAQSYTGTGIMFAFEYISIMALFVFIAYYVLSYINK